MKYVIQSSRAAPPSAAHKPTMDKLEHEAVKPAPSDKRRLQNDAPIRTELESSVITEIIHTDVAMNSQVHQNSTRSEAQRMPTNVPIAVQIAIQLTIDKNIIFVGAQPHDNFVVY